MSEFISAAKKLTEFFQGVIDTNRPFNEADTSKCLCKFFEDVLGYDMLTDITKEFAIKDRYVDLAIVLDGEVQFLVEAKKMSEPLKERHIEQASAYAANHGIEWVVLTNAVEWHLYHLEFDSGIETNLVFSANLLKDFKGAMEHLAVLHKKSIAKDGLATCWNSHSTLSPRNVLQAILSKEGLAVIRRLVRKMSSGAVVAEDKLAETIRGMIDRKALEELADVKVGAKLTRKKKKVAVTTGNPVPCATPLMEPLQNVQTAAPDLVEATATSEAGVAEGAVCESE